MFPLVDLVVVDGCHLRHDIWEDFLIAGVPEAQAGENMEGQEEELNASLERGNEQHPQR